MTTKFTADDRLDIAEMERCFALQLDAGVDGLIVCGSLGEASTLEPDEKIEILKTALRVAKGRVPVLLTVVEGSTRRARRWPPLALMLAQPASWSCPACPTSPTPAKPWRITARWRRPAACRS